MKTVILILLLFLGLSVTGQNGGQFFENNVIRIEHVGYSAGVHTFKVYNKQNCEARIRTKVDNEPAVDIQVAPNSYVNVNTPISSPKALLFRSKAETACISNPDMGWLEINTANLVLNLVNGNTVTVVRGPDVFKASILNGFYKSSYTSKFYTETIVVYDVLGAVKYKTTTVARKYNHVYLDNHLQRGLNYIEVTIETNKIERFIFKYLK